VRLDVLTQWGIRTLGELAALPAAELSSRLGWQALGWQATARGVDPAPLVPTPPEERFEAAIELEWPIEELEPLSFVLTRLLEPLSARLERRDRGAAVVRTALRLVTRDLYSRSLQLPSPMRDARTLRTLILLDLESHPPPAAIDGVVIAVEPTPGRVVQHTLFARARPTPERLSTLVARLTALMGQTRVGAPATVDSYRPGTFELVPFPIDQPPEGGRPSTVRRQEPRPADSGPLPGRCPVTALRRCRHPVPARAVVEHGVPIRVTTDRCGFPGGKVVLYRGPWRTSGQWWNTANSELSTLNSEVSSKLFFDRDEWDVALGDGGMYRVFRDRETNQWFIDAVVD
jgi:protein ImuB